MPRVYSVKKARRDNPAVKTTDNLEIRDSEDFSIEDLLGNIDWEL